MTTIVPNEETAYWMLEDAETNGVTEVGELTGVSDGLGVAWGEGEDAYAQQIASTSASFPPLPDVGEWLGIGAIYDYQPELLMVRQSHYRTHYAPEDTPALFMAFRQDGGESLEWIEGEQVFIDTLRTFDGDEYKCIQEHVTQSDWTPPATPTLWALVTTEPETNEWTYPISYVIGDTVLYNGSEYECIQAHTSLAGWSPSAVASLWAKL